MELDNKKNFLPRLGEKVRQVKNIRITKKMKKNLIVAASVALIGGAVLLNWAFFTDGGGASPVAEPDNSPAVNDAVGDADDYFAVSQISRQRARDDAMEVLQTIVENDEALDEVKNEAWNDITTIAQQIEAEANIETLVISKGIEECVAVISQDAATVIVRSDGLMENQITQIQEIVYEQSGIPVENLKIIEK